MRNKQRPFSYAPMFRVMAILFGTHLGRDGMASAVTGLSLELGL